MSGSPSGRRPAVIKRDHAARLGLPGLPGDEPPAPAPLAGHGPCEGDLQVRLGRKGSDATELHITCPCGRTAVVVCEHEAAA